MTEKMQPAAWIIDWPDEPELGFCFAEKPNHPDYGRSSPLFTADQLAQARRDGIEAAAKVCDEAGWSAHPTELAAAIRALPDEADQ